MEASLPIKQAIPVTGVSETETTLSPGQLYQNDLMLVALRDKLRLNVFVFLAGVMAFTAGVVFVLFLLAGAPGASTGYYVRAAIQTFIVFPILAWLYFRLPDYIASLFNTLQANKIVADLQQSRFGISSYGDFLIKVVMWEDQFWWVAATLAFVVMYTLYRLLIADPRMPSAQPFWLEVASLIGNAFMIYSTLLTIKRLLVALFFTNILFSIFNIRVNPLHPDGSAGLAFLNVMLRVSVFLVFTMGLTALVLNTTFLSGSTDIYAILEAVIISVVYVILSLVLLIGWLQAPHQAMVEARNDVLQALASEFRAAVLQTAPAENADANAIKAGTDRLNELKRRYQLLQDTYPTWPVEIVQVRRLVGTISLPALITLLWPFISKLLPYLGGQLNHLLQVLH